MQVLLLYMTFATVSTSFSINLFGTEYFSFDFVENIDGFEFSSQNSVLRITISPEQVLIGFDDSKGYIFIKTAELVIEFRNDRIFIKARTDENFIVDRFEIFWEDFKGNYCENSVEEILLSDGRFFQLKYSTNEFLFCEDFEYEHNCDDEELQSYEIFHGLEKEMIVPIRNWVGCQKSRI